MTKLQYYDLEIKPFRTIKGHGLFQLAAEAVNTKGEEEELTGWEQEIEMYNIE